MHTNVTSLEAVYTATPTGWLIPGNGAVADADNDGNNDVSDL